MKQFSARALLRVSVSVLAALILVAPAVAKPKGGAVGKASNTGSQHGKAVRVAAQCPVKGKAHGQLVKSIAKNKDATVEDAQAACDAALALQNPPAPAPTPTPTPTP